MAPQQERISPARLQHDFGFGLACQWAEPPLVQFVPDGVELNIN